MAKATHIGSCQICGHRQKLPNGLLSNHGYTTRWGFFNGICSGAKHLPFEQSIGLIEDIIASVKRNIVTTTARADAVRVQTDKVFVSVYRPARWGSNGRSIPSMDEEYEIPVTSLLPESTGYRIKFIDPKTVGTEKPKVAHHDVYESTLAEAVLARNGRKANSIMATVKQMEEYVKWQEGRIKNWAPSPLEEVK